MKDLILTIEPTASETRLALFRGERPIASHSARHHGTGAAGADRAPDHGSRARCAREFVLEAGVATGELGAVASTGGLLKPVSGGTYLVDELMLRDCQRSDRGQHPANAGPLVAREIAAEHGCPAFVVDPLSVDELEPVATLAGGREAARACFGSVLGIRAVARRHARAVERGLEQLKLVVARLGFDPCVSAVREGRVVDGIIPIDEPLLKQLGVADVRRAEERAELGDAKAMIVLDAVAYQVAKSIGAVAAGLGGEIDAVLLTGDGADATAVVNGVCRRVEWIAPVFVYPGADDLLALAEGAWRVLSGEERAKSY